MIKSINRNEERKLYKHFKKNDFLDPAMYGGASFFIDPFLSNRMKRESVLIIWDVFLSEGYKWIFRVIIGILRKYKKKLMKLDMAGMKTFIFAIYSEISPEEIVKLAKKIFLPNRNLVRLEKNFKMLN